VGWVAGYCMPLRMAVGLGGLGAHGWHKALRVGEGEGAFSAAGTSCRAGGLDN